MIALVDANSFYASSEMVFNPGYRDKPLIVLSNNDGTIVAINSKAKAIPGLSKFEPFFKVKSLCEQYGVVVKSSNYELYSDLSSRMMSVIGRFAPDQYIYSIDESMLDFSRCYPAIPCLREHGLLIRKRVWKECKLPVCVGMGPNITLSKVANKVAKTDRKYSGVCVLESKDDIYKALADFPVSEVWGIGRKLTQRLKFMGITNALQFAQLDPKRARKEFNVLVEETVRELNGQKCIHWSQERADQLQIFSTRTFGDRVTSLEGIQQALSLHAGIASRKARKQGSLAKVMMCFASNSAYDAKPVHLKAVHHFPYPTADVDKITAAANQMASRLFREGVNYAKVGVGLVELTNGKQYQPDLFNPNPNNDKLMGVFDALNNKYGKDAVFLAAQGINEKWGMRREFLSRQYTTRWTHLPVIKC